MVQLEKLLRRMVRRIVRQELSRTSTSPKQFRLKAGLTLDALRDRLAEKGYPVSLRQLQRYEAGRAGSDRRVERRIKAICEVLNCSQADYFEGANRNG